MANNKTELMEILSKLPQETISNDLFLWAASNLPDVNAKGPYNDLQVENAFKFNHDSNDFYESVGFSREWAHEAVDEIKSTYEALVKEEGSDLVKSKALETFLKKDKSSLFFFAIYGYTQLWDNLLRPHGEEMIAKFGPSGSKKGIFDSIPPHVKEAMKNLGIPDPSELSTDMIKRIISLDLSKIKSIDEIPKDLPEGLKQLIIRIILDKNKRK